MTTRRKLVAGNWKMNGLKASLSEVRAMVDGAKALSGVDLSICPPATLISAVASALEGSAIGLGGQDCHAERSGAFTGDISPEMLADTGAGFVIVGHSERRAGHGETDAVVAAKASAAYRAGLTPIICVGESLEQRDRGETLAVIAGQLAGSIPDAAATTPTVIAYEPIWAIGTGRTPTTAQVAEVHAAMVATLQQRFGAAAEGIRLLYGGSVKPENARELMHVPGVDGALVGGASLKAGDFLKIAAACA
ncbi:MAG: triose-phosphate isomerase [Rhodobacterales bacterium 12-64-8]|nr:MAG: triose-phosphate isomerase [Rhodobacterales bacterium 12-64-8]OYX50323.1 MAG: triose-phosphate isomerase [Alphaproteobacteria bacterium 32-64-14]